jgi:orotate phosphoribosyltransferase
MNQDERERLLTLLKTKSYRAGQVVLSSGKVSDFYVDCKQTSLSAEGALLCGRLLFRLIVKHFPEARAVGGPTLGADPLVSVVAVISMIEGHPLDAFIIRKEPKEHGTAAWIEGMANLPEGHPVVLLEDVITTGGSTLRSIQRVVEAKLKVLGVCVLLDRNEGGKEAIEAKGIPCLSLYNRSDFVAL